MLALSPLCTGAHMHPRNSHLTCAALAVARCQETVRQMVHLYAPDMKRAPALPTPPRMHPPPSADSWR